MCLLLLMNVCCLHAQSGTGICPDSIFIFQLNDLAFDFTIEGIDDSESVQWNFGDGTVVVGAESVQHVFSEGTFLITAIFMDADCPWDGPTVLNVEITVAPCWLSLSYVQRNEGLFTFTATGFPEVYPMYWEMGDGTQIVETWVVDHQYAPGTYEACAWVVTSFCYDTMYACIEVTIDDVVIHTAEFFGGSIKSGMNIFPSPVHDVLNIQPTILFNIRGIRIYSVFGKMIYEYNGIIQQINTEGWHSGTYVIEFLCEDGTTTREKFVKN